MFENLLAQEEAGAALRADIERGELPPSLLFAGPPASGKLTAALELARVFSCEAPKGGEPAPWACSCGACSRHRVLAHPDLLLLGPRSFPEEIPAALELLERAPGRAGAYFSVRAIRKLARRFDAALYEGEETRLAKAMPLVRDIEERLDAVAPERAMVDALAPGSLEAARAAAATAAKLEPMVPDMPPVFQVRALEAWARLAPWGKAKTVVIENAERMLDSSRNALLKILEEPPRSVRFILLSPRPGAIIGTVLSRLRPYAFRPRDAAGSALVLERVFRVPAGYHPGGSQLGGSHPGGGSADAAGADLAAFLEARRPFPPATARAHARAFLGEALLRCDALRDLTDLPDDAVAGSALPALLEVTKDFGARDEAYDASFREFLRALQHEIGSLLRDPRLGAGGAAILEAWADLVRDAGIRRASLNLQASLLAEGLLSALGDP